MRIEWDCRLLLEVTIVYEHVLIIGLKYSTIYNQQQWLETI